MHPRMLKLGIPAFFALILPTVGCRGVETQFPAGAPDDAAPLYLEAFQNLSGIREPADPVEMSALLPVVGEAPLPPLGTPMPADQKEVVAKYVAINAKCLSLLHEAAAIRECRWPAEYQDTNASFDLQMQILRFWARIRQAERVLDLEAIYLAESGKPELAAQSIQAGLVLASRLTSLDKPIPLMVREVCESLILNALQRVLNLTPVPDTELTKLAQSLATAESSVSLHGSESLTKSDVDRVLGLWHADLRVAQTALAVERFRASERKLPATLDELAPRYLPVVPTDPFDGLPLRYRRTEKGYIVYSIGPAKIDQGGVRGKETRLKGNLPFSVEREAGQLAK